MIQEPITDQTTMQVPVVRAEQTAQVRRGPRFTVRLVAVEPNVVEEASAGPRIYKGSTGTYPDTPLPEVEDLPPGYWSGDHLPHFLRGESEDLTDEYAPHPAYDFTALQDLPMDYSYYVHKRNTEPLVHARDESLGGKIHERPRPLDRLLLVLTFLLLLGILGGVGFGYLLTLINLG